MNHDCDYINGADWRIPTFREDILLVVIGDASPLRFAFRSLFALYCALALQPIQGKKHKLVERLHRDAPPLREGESTHMISPLSAEEYLAQRVEGQLQWYENKSRRNKRAYQWLRVYEILAAAMIPFLTGYLNDQASYVKFTVGTLGVSIAVISGILALYRLQENWLQYRTTCEALTREKYYFLTQAAPYDTADRFPLFVQRVEAILSEENSKWAHSVATSEKKSADVDN